MKHQDLDNIALGTPAPTGDDWYFTPRPADGLDDADVTLVVNPAIEAARAAETGKQSEAASGH
jgi:hypothetical protein